MNHDDLTAEQKGKVAECRAPEDMVELAEEDGYELSGEVLEDVSGGIIVIKSPKLDASS